MQYRDIYATALAMPIAILNLHFNGNGSEFPLVDGIQIQLERMMSLTNSYTRIGFWS